MRSVARRRKLTLPDDTTVTAEVGLGPRDDDAGFMLDVKLRIHIPAMDKGEARTLAEQAHLVCPYSNATRNGLDVQLEVV